MTDVLDRYYEVYRMYKKSFQYLDKYDSSFCNDIEEAINNYFNNHSIDNGIEFCSLHNDYGIIHIGLDKDISLDDVSAIAELLYLDVVFYNKEVIRFAIKEE